MSSSTSNSEGILILASEYLSQLSVLRLETSDKKLARHIGEIYVSQQTNLTNPEIKPFAEKVIFSLRADLEKIAADPLLSQQFVQGLFDELKGRGYFEIKDQK